MGQDENVEDVFDERANVSTTIMGYNNFYSSMDMIKDKGFTGVWLRLRYAGLIALLKSSLLMGGGKNSIREPGKSHAYLQSLAMLFLFLSVTSPAFTQTALRDSTARECFIQQQKLTSRSFNAYFNPNITALYGADERMFVQKIDSLRNTFILPLDQLKKNNPAIGNAFFEEQYADLNYTFDKFLLDYVPVHKRITGQTVTLSKATQIRLKSIDINNPSLIPYDAFRKYLNSVLQQGIDTELQKRGAAY